MCVKKGRKQKEMSGKEREAEKINRERKNK